MPSSSSWRNERWAWVAALAALGVVYGGALVDDQVFIFRDLLQTVLPEAMVKASAFHAGEWPLWAPELYGGYPVAGNLSSQTFYPFIVVYALPSTRVALWVFIVGHHAWAMLGTAKWARAVGVAPPFAFVAALAFGCSAFSVTQDNLLIHLCAASWLPWALCAAEAVIEQRWVAGAAGVAVTLALAFLAGDPQLALVAGVLVAARIGFEIMVAPERRGARLGRAVLALGAGCVAAAALAAVALWPALDLLAVSDRQSMVTAASAQEWAFDPRRAIEWLAPHAFGRWWPTSTYWGQSTITGPFRYPYALSVYTSAAVVACVPTGALALQRGQRWFFGVAGVGLLSIALGARLPVYEWLFLHVPGWRTFRYPERLLPEITLLWSVLGSFGLGRAFERAQTRPFIAASVVVFIFAGWCARASHPWADAAWAGAWLAVVGVVVAQAGRRPWALPALITLVALDLVAQAHAFTWTASLSDLRAALPKEVQAPDRVFSAPPSRNAEAFETQADELRTATDSVAHLEPNTGLVFGLEYFAGYGSNLPLVFRKQWATVATVPLLRLWGVRWLLLPEGDAQTTTQGHGHVELVRELPDRQRLMKLTDMAPMAWFPQRVRVLKGKPDLAAWLQGLEDRVTDEATVAVPFSAGVPPTAPAETTVACEAPSHQQLRCRTNTPEPALLVIRQSAADGWFFEVRDEGQEPRPLAPLVANLTMQAAVVPAGQHDLVFRYSPRSVRWGAAISLVAALAVLAAWASTRATSLRSRSS